MRLMCKNESTVDHQGLDKALECHTPMMRQKLGERGILDSCRLWGALLLLCFSGLARAAPGTEIVYEDRDPQQPAYTSRILILGEQMRMDYGQDTDDFILFDASQGNVQIVNHASGNVIVIPAEGAPAGEQLAWREIAGDGGAGNTRIVLAQPDERVCAEYRVAPLLGREMAVMRAFSQALSVNHGRAWSATPAELRDPCDWLLLVQEAGVEYRRGLPMYIGYATGGSRIYKNHVHRDISADLFQFPADYPMFTVQ